MVNDPAESELNLTGKALQVYLYLLSKGQPCGVREIQRGVRLSSPSVAEYQIEKLVEMGVAERDQFGRARIVKKVNARALKSHVVVRGFMFPRLALYAATFSAVAIAYSVLSGKSFSIYDECVPAAAAALFWFESSRSWQIFRSASRTKGKDSRIFWTALAPGAAAIAVFVTASMFLSTPVLSPARVPAPSPPGDAPLGYVPTPPPTVDDFIKMSSERGHMADQSGVNLIHSLTPGLAITLALAGSLAAGFIAYVLYSLRESNDPAVRTVEHRMIGAIGTQGYPKSIE